MQGFLDSLAANKIDTKLVDGKVDNFVLEGAVVVGGEKFTFCMETQDSVDIVDLDCLMRSDWYFKTSRSTEWLASRPDRQLFAHRVVPIPLYRTLNHLGAEDLVPKTTMLRSFSWGVTLTKNARLNLYRELVLIAKNDTSKVDLHILDGDRKGEAIFSSKDSSSYPALSGDFTQYQKFLKGAYFLLNVQGIGLSQPFRLLDGCGMNLPAVSEHILADAYKNFPTYPISSHTHYESLPLVQYPNGMNKTALKREMEYLFENVQDVARRILDKQKVWCRRLTPQMYAHYVLAFVQGTPFKSSAFSKDAETAKVLYDFASEWETNVSYNNLIRNPQWKTNGAQKVEGWHEMMPCCRPVDGSLECRLGAAGGKCLWGTSVERSHPSQGPILFEGDVLVRRSDEVGAGLFSLYVDILHTDDTWAYGIQLEYDRKVFWWQRLRRLYRPEKLVKGIFLYIMSSVNATWKNIRLNQQETSS